MKRPFNPDKEVCDYCDHIMHAHIQVLRENKDERTWYWDYPAVAAVSLCAGRVYVLAGFHFPIPQLSACTAERVRCLSFQNDPEFGDEGR